MQGANHYRWQPQVALGWMHLARSPPSSTQIQYRFSFLFFTLFQFCEPIPAFPTIDSCRACYERASVTRVWVREQQADIYLFIYLLYFLCSAKAQISSNRKGRR